MIFVSIVLLILVILTALGSGCVSGCKDEYNKCTEKCPGSAGSHEREQCIQKCISNYDTCTQAPIQK